MSYKLKRVQNIVLDDISRIEAQCEELRKENENLTKRNSELCALWLKAKNGTVEKKEAKKRCQSFYHNFCVNCKVEFGNIDICDNNYSPLYGRQFRWNCAEKVRPCCFS